MELPSDGTAPDDALRQPVRALQIIHGAMVAGVVAYLALVVGMRLTRPPLTEAMSRTGDSTMPTMATLFAVAAVVASALLPPVVADRMARTNPLGQPLAGSGPVSPSILLAPLSYRLCLALKAVLDGSTVRLDPATRGAVLAWQSGHLVGVALLEAAAFFAVFVFSAGNVPGWFVAVPIGLIALMAIRFPTRAGVADWIDARRAEIDAGLHG